MQNNYSGRNLNITDLHADNEFDKAAIKYFLVPAIIHIYRRKEYAVPIERSTCTIKERYRSTYHILLYNMFIKLMIDS